MRETEQIDKWAGDFGREYTDRNSLDLESLDDLYRNRFQVTRTEMNDRFLRNVDRSAKILEVGSNVGNQLLLLQKMGFRNLYGIELQEYAVEASKRRTRAINIIQGNAFDIPYKDAYFDLVFTSGVLIHIGPRELPLAMKEITRVTRRFVWGFEYYAPEMTEVEYRGNKNLLWKADYERIYHEQDLRLKVIQRELFPHTDGENVDMMFLMEKV